MKKAFLLFIAIISSMLVYAQDIDTPIVNAPAVSIDSLALRMNKLQHDFDYLQCEYQLYKAITDMKLFSNGISNSSNSLITNIYHTRYDRELYDSYAENYEAVCGYFESLKKQVDSVKLLVYFKVMEADFSESELNVLNGSLEVLQMTINTVESALNQYDVALKSYKNK